MEDKSKEFEVLFHHNRGETEVVPSSGQIIVSPVDERWNDFGYKIKAKFSVYLDRFEPYEGTLLIGFFESDFDLKKSSDNKNTSLTRVLETFSNQAVKKNQLPQFFTLLPDINAYRELRLNFELDIAEEILLALNDLVIGKEHNEKLVEMALQTEVFRLAFMRNSEPFYAFHNAEFVFTPHGNEFEANISDELILKFQLEGFSKAHEVHLKYDKQSIIPRRIAVLIGKNGLGKSESLKAFCRAALQYADKNISLKDAHGKRPMINRIIAISTPGETSNTFPREMRATQKLHYRRLSLTRKGTKTIGDSLVQLARSQEYIGDLRRWDIFYDSLELAFTDLDNLFIELNDGRFAPFKSLELPGGEEQRLKVWSMVSKSADPKMRMGENYYPLSSGQLTFFKFALMSCLHIENGSFVLMDEPETHLHPNLISDFVGLLDNLLEKTNSYALIATHSAYFVREVARQQVHIFKLNNEQNCVDVATPRLRTFGADVESISHFVFDEDVDNNLTSKIIAKVKGRSFESIAEEIGAEVSMATLLNIKDKL